MNAAGRRKFFSRCACCEPKTIPARHAVNRRTFVAGGMAAIGAGFSAAPAEAQVSAKPHRIDVHHHIVPPVHAQALTSHRSNWRQYDSNVTSSSVVDGSIFQSQES